MTSIPPPHGMSDYDYESIEAAVTETVRGRWFLTEFARRNRVADSAQILAAISRVESLVSAPRAALPPPSADPSIRLLVQRIKEIANQLDGLGLEMQDAGIDEEFCEAVAFQARAVAGLMRTGPAPTPVLQPAERPRRSLATPTLAVPPAPPMPAPVEAPAPSRPPVTADPRLAILSGLDGLPAAKKLALFT